MKKTKSEIILDEHYIDIIRALESLFDFLDIDKKIIDKKLNNNEITQTELDYELLGIIDSVEDY